MKVGVFGGSFDPIHNGHINLAQYVLDHTDLDEVWLMVSPLNPLKPQGYVATDAQRLEMARLAVSGIPGVKVSDFEFSLPIPSYTYNTLTKLKEAYPEVDFRLIIGGDNWAHFDRWRNPKEILEEFGVIVYPRPGEEIHPPAISPLTLNPSLLTLLKDAPQMPVSSTQLRALLSEKDCVAVEGRFATPPEASEGNFFDCKLPALIPASVLDYIRANGLYASQSSQHTPCASPRV